MLHDPVDDSPHGFELAQLVLDRQFVAFGQGRVFFEHGAHDLDALDGVDAEVGLEIEVEIEHLGRVAGTLAHDTQEVGSDRLPVLSSAGGRRFLRCGLRCRNHLDCRFMWKGDLGRDRGRYRLDLWNRGRLFRRHGYGRHLDLGRRLDLGRHLDLGRRSDLGRPFACLCGALQIALHDRLLGFQEFAHHLLELDDDLIGSLYRHGRHGNLRVCVRT